MTSRNAMFGRQASTPYAGGTGHAGSAASRERQENEDEGGISAFRQQQVIGHLDAAGSTGLTWFELGEKMGWHHGQSTGALSVLHKAGDIKALTEKRGKVGKVGGRGKSTIYVLADYVLGRETREPGQTRGNARADEAEAAKVAKIAEFEAKITAMSAEIADMDEAFRGMEDDRRADAQLLATHERNLIDKATQIRGLQEQLRLGAQLTEQYERERNEARAEAARHFETLMSVRADVEQIKQETEERIRVVQGLMVQRALMQADEDEVPVIAETLTKLANATDRPGDLSVSIRLETLRTLAQVAARAIPTEREREARRTEG